MAGMTALPLQQLIASFDRSSLPKILQVCSGVYFQGRRLTALFIVLSVEIILLLSDLNPETEVAVAK